MSLNELFLDQVKPWCNVRLNEVVVDSNLQVRSTGGGAPAIGDALVAADTKGNLTYSTFVVPPYTEVTSTTSTVTSSIWSTPKACTWKLTVIGRLVTLNLSNVSAQADVNTPGKILHSQALPMAYWPTGVYLAQLIEVNNNTALGSETVGDVEVSPTNGIIGIGASSGGANFTGGAPGANVSGFRQFSCSWQI